MENGDVPNFICHLNKEYLGKVPPKADFFSKLLSVKTPIFLEFPDVIHRAVDMLDGVLTTPPQIPFRVHQAPPGIGQRPDRPDHLQVMLISQA